MSWPIITERAGTTYHRIFSESLDNQKKRNYEAYSLNPYNWLRFDGKKLVVADTGEDAFDEVDLHRFTPIVDNGQIIPAIYCGTSFEAAIHETLFRGHDNNFPEPITMSDLDGMFHSQIQLKNDLRLIHLDTSLMTDTGDGTMKVSAQNTIWAKHSTKAYRDCHNLATDIYQNFPDVDGLAWESRHLANSFNIVYWGRPQRSNNPFGDIEGFGSVEERLILGDGLQRVISEAQRCQIPCMELISTLAR